MSILNGFIGLGESLAKPLTNLITQQGVSMPAPKPVGSNTFSFDFGGAAEKLFDVFKPQNQAGAKILGSVADAGSGIISAAGEKIQSVLRGGNQQPTNTSVQNSYVPYSNALPSQTTFDLSSALSLFGSLSDQAGARSSAADEIAAAAATNTRNNVILIGGAALMLVLLMNQKGAK